MNTPASINSGEAIQIRLSKGLIPHFGPFLMLVARPLFILLTQGFTFLLFKYLNVPDAGIAVRNWWTVTGTLVDFGCLGLLIWLTKREGIHLFDLIGFIKSRLKTDIPLGFGIFIIVFPVTIFGCAKLTMLIAYGSTNPVFPEHTFIRTLPLLAAIYSRVLWWPIWSATEEMTYDGYALPRLKAMTNSTWLSVSVVCFFYSIQHSVLPWVNMQHALYVFLTFIPLTIALTLIYLRVRRLTPLIIGHWMMDFFSTIFMIHIG